MIALARPLRLGPTAPPHAARRPLTQRVWASILRGLHRIGRQRAANELQRLAACCDGVDPELASQLRATSTSCGASR